MLAPMLTLAACAAQAPPVVPAPAAPVPAPTIAWLSGATPDAVIARLGPPTLDRHEKDGRHLQFAYAPCIVDVYFFPPAPGASLAATYSEARRAEGGAMDALACIEAQRQRRIAKPVG